MIAHKKSESISDISLPHKAASTSRSRIPNGSFLSTATTFDTTSPIKKAYHILLRNDIGECLLAGIELIQQQPKSQAPPFSASSNSAWTASRAHRLVIVVRFCRHIYKQRDVHLLIVCVGKSMLATKSKTGNDLCGS
jgi:hypothetical protein